MIPPINIIPETLRVTPMECVRPGAFRVRRFIKPRGGRSCTPSGPVNRGLNRSV